MNLKSIFRCALRALFGSLFISYAADAAEHTTDTLAVVKTNIDQGKAVFVDVREKAEWDQGHLQGALWMPLSQLRRGAAPDTLDSRIDKETICYTHCKAGGRSLTAADILTKLGYEVRPLKQGTADLIKAGFPKAE